MNPDKHDLDPGYGARTIFIGERHEAFQHIRIWQAGARSGRAAPMKILFYLPVVTPWWFEAIVVPMLRTLHNGAEPVELHVMVAPLWRNTGLEAEHLLLAGDLTAVHWHVIDEGEPDQFRLAGAEVPGLLDLVAAIDADLTLARSADFAISRQFPGVVRYIMEGGAPPFACDPRWVVIEEHPFTAAAVPIHAIALADACAERLRPGRELVEQCAPAGTRSALRGRLDLPDDRPVIAVPLLYEHEENYFARHAAFPNGPALIEHLLAELGDTAVLAVADHPLNRMYADQPQHRLYVDRRDLDACLARHAGHVVDCTGPRATQTLAICADAMIADISKSWMLAAFHGMSLIDIAPQPAADWLRAVRGLAGLPAALTAGELAPPDRAVAQRWFGWHLGGRFVAPAELTFDRLLRCLEQRPNEADIAGNLAMVLANQRNALARQDEAA